MARLTGTSQKRAAWINWLDKCRSGDWANPMFFGRTIGGVPVPWVDAIRALEAAFKAGGYTPSSAWAYNFRGIGGKPCSCSNYGYCSLHGFGIAIDIDPRVNPYISTSTFSWGSTRFTPEQVALVEAIKNTKGEQLWFWGGRWSSIKDYMHWEAYVDPASTAVNWDTVPGEVAQGEQMRLAKGSEGQEVAELQKIMAEAFNQDNGTWTPLAGKSAYDRQPFAAGEDGDFGGTCETNLKNVQGILGQPKTGVIEVGGVLWGALVLERYGSKGGGVTAAEVDNKIKAHESKNASSSVHPHKHDEGETSGPR